MDKVWLVKVIFTDEATYSYDETVGVCTDELEAIQVEEEAKEVYSDCEVYIEEVVTNKFIGYRS